MENVRRLLQGIVSREPDLPFRLREEFDQGGIDRIRLFEMQPVRCAFEPDYLGAGAFSLADGRK